MRRFFQNQKCTANCLYFPEHYKIQEKWKEIKLEAIQTRQKGYVSNIKGDKFFKNIADDNWKKFYIKWYGNILPEARKMCPTICNILDKLPQVYLAMFSILDPGGIITPHCGPSKGALRYHLGLQCPKDYDASIVVDGVSYRWEDGKDILFDDTYQHHVKNNSKTTSRIILFCDVGRKMKTKKNTFINDKICRTFGPIINKVNNRQEKSQIR